MGSGNQKAHALIVEDEQNFREMVRDALTEYNYAVDMAGSGEEALEILKRKRFDIMISDISMPGITGIELAREASKMYVDMPIVLLTGLSDIELAKHAMRQGISDYITKPFKLSELPIVIERNLERRRHEAKKVMEQKEDVLIKAIEALVAAIDAKDHYTSGHSKRVAYFAMCVADDLGLTEEQKYILKLSATMHDVGKIGMPDGILKKPASLEEMEYLIVRGHPVAGFNILSRIDEFLEVASIVRHHHERYDGSGYPDGLKGEAIPLIARIVTIADAYDALVSTRPYRKGCAPEKALAEMRNHVGTQFDPYLFEVFERNIIEKGKNPPREEPPVYETPK
jgi:putative nucleotidyltransferase with HDIG domain